MQALALAAFIVRVTECVAHSGAGASGLHSRLRLTTTLHAGVA